MTAKLEEKHSDRRTVQELIIKFSARIRALAKQKNPAQEKIQELLTKEFVTDLQSQTDKIREEERIRKIRTELLNKREIAEILEGMEPAEPPDPDLIGIPPDTNLKALRRGSPPQKNKFTRLSPRKPRPGDL